MATPFKTILWKELRENFKWAALAAAVLTVAQIYVLHVQPDVIINRNTHITFLFGCALAGAALGAIQILPELNRDRWAALLHRPVPRSTLFLGKVTAGLLLYALAAGLPFLASVLFVSLPGLVAAPFFPAMAVPAASNVIFGIVFYAGALLVSLTHGRWYGRRALLALSVLPLFFFQLGTDWIFLPALGMSLILLTAAYGAMCGNGSASHAFPAARWSLAFAMFAGAEIFMGVLMVLLLVLWVALQPNSSNPPSSGSPRRFVLTKDGQPLLSSYDGGLHLTYPDGSPFTDKNYIENATSYRFAQFFPVGWNLKNWQAAFDAALAEDPLRRDRYLQVAAGNNDNGAEYWYYLVRKNYFAGYDKLTRRRVAICDVEGFHSADAAPKPFPIRLEHPIFSRSAPYYYWSGNQLYSLDFGDRTMKLLYTAPLGRIYASAPVCAGETPVYLLLAFENAVQILDLHGKPLATAPYGHDPAIWPGLFVATVPGGERVFILYDPNFQREMKPGNPSLPSFVDEIDLQGRVVRSDSAVTQEASPPESNGSLYLGLVPPFVSALYTASGGRHPEAYDTIPSILSDLGRAASSKSFLGLVTALSAACAAITFWWARRAGLAKREAIHWTLFVFLFSLPGLVAFRLAAPWPTRVPCPSCSRKRPIETEECPACHQAWPPPKTSGTEIFAGPIG
ncbi:hypothetical protein CfE428DRAFT_0685 [Chthoniobacter flavus Ellin428]|uniref:Uncharacterized protein n=1 Tax=Chthoniobacter flavus Ellin428 TaxID=497964 RepID=B4CVJ8_9BACT|nr:hypothetical protein [Chthoniobacter flavus]EDY21440.1 hypothetical protein CfE428DRAFT_0685 [Chthoniobacter flavus Ellin428]TCO95397.1 ABC-type transport system involved in multi-copper enzyme maturation permease subunit [Chthoniobacter flavus]